MRRRFRTSDRFRALLFGLTEGVLIASLAVNVRDAVREDAFFQGVVTEAVGDSRPQADEETLLKILHKTHRMIAPIQQGIAEGSVEDVSGLAGYRRILSASVANDALFPAGACGSYAGVLVKLLKTCGFPVRFVQMLDNEEARGDSCHILVEAWLDGRWVACDAMYDLVFRGDEGRILGCEEIRRDWDRVKAQCPAGYDMRYDYRGFRRVNFGALNAWLQRTPLASWSVRVWLIEGAWIRTLLVASLLVFVVACHVWCERPASGPRDDAAAA